MKLTPWFDWSHKPARQGVYELGQGGRPLMFPFHHWNGIHWGPPDLTPAAAATDLDLRFKETHEEFYMGHTCQWRGLAEPTKEKK